MHRELMILAHEYGHFRSWADESTKARWEAYFEASKKRQAIIEAMQAGSSERDLLAKGLTDFEKMQLVAEEDVAWKHGRAALVELAFNALELYDRQAVHGVHCHRYKLGLDELWPEDEAE